VAIKAHLGDLEAHPRVVEAHQELCGQRKSANLVDLHLQTEKIVMQKISENKNTLTNLSSL
jgi:hypothetical protein